MEIKNLIGGLLAGAAIGVTVGVLLAPGSGEQTRKKIVKASKDAVKDLKASFEENIESLKTQYKRGVDDVAKRGRDFISHANEKIRA